MLLTTLSFFALSSAEAVKNDNIFNLDDWFNDFKNIFKRPADPMIPLGKSYKVVKEAILLDFRDGKKATYNENGLKFNTNPTVPFVMTPTQIRYGDVLIHRRMSLSQVLEGLKNSKIVKKAELRIITASDTEVYTSTRYVVESKKPYKFEEQRRESKSSFDKKNRQSILNKKIQEFDRDLVAFLNGSSTQPPQAKVQEKSVVKPKTPVKRTAVKVPPKIAPKAPVKVPAKVAPVKTQIPASPRKRTVVPADQNTHQDIKKPRTTTREIHRKRSAVRRAIAAKRSAMQRNTRTKHSRRRR